jgi:hypothetical protein
MIISPSRNFIFIHLEKCGGTSVESALEPYLDWSDLLMGSTEFGESRQYLLFEQYGMKNVKDKMFWKHSTAEDICKNITIEEWEKFNKISVVRDPMKIMTSLFFFSEKVIALHIGRINANEWKRMIETKTLPERFPYNDKYVEAYVRSHISGSGFNGFVNYLLDKNFDFVKPQIQRLRGHSKQKDLGLIIDLSQLDDRWQEILNLVGIEDEVELKHLNTTDREDVFISDRTRKIIKNHFALDYQELPKYTGVHW